MTAAPPDFAPPAAADGRPLDDDVDAVWRALQGFRRQPGAAVVIRRPHWASLHVLVVADSFAGVRHFDRADRLWDALADLPPDVQAQLAQVSASTPGEEVPPGFEDGDPRPPYPQEPPTFHRTRPRSVWALAPSVGPDGEYAAGFTFAAVPTVGRLTWVGGESRRTLFPTPEAAAEAAFAQAERQPAGQSAPALAAA